LEAKYFWNSQDKSKAETGTEANSLINRKEVEFNWRNCASENKSLNSKNLEKEVKSAENLY
jgi:hypothetical protein